MAPGLLSRAPTSWFRDDVVVAGAAVDLVGAVAADEDVGPPPPDVRGVLEPVEWPVDEVHARAAVHRVLARAGVDVLIGLPRRVERVGRARLVDAEVALGEA